MDFILATSDPETARYASDLCGKTDRVRINYSVSESSNDAHVGLLSGKASANRSSVSTSKTYQKQKDAVFDDISEIMFNPDSTCWVEREGIVRREPGAIFNAGELHAGLEVIANRFGKQLDADHPILNVRLPDGSRLSAMIAPVVGPEPLLNIRKFGLRRYTLDHLVTCGTVPPEMVEPLREAIRNRKNILISGATGTGKATLLNALADEIPGDERIFIIEDTAEIRLNKPHVISSESQSNTHKQEISFDALLKATLRHRPNRILLG